MSVKIGRNDPCQCGRKRPNGRPMKFKHCCENKDNHEPNIYIAADPLIEQGGVLTGFEFTDDGKVILLGKEGEKIPAKDVLTLTGKETESKSGVFSRISTNVQGAANHLFPSKHPLSLTTYLSRFDLIFALDTNTEEIEGKDVSVCVFFRVIAESERNDKQAMVKVPSGLAKTIYAKVEHGSCLVVLLGPQISAFTGLSGGEAEKYATAQYIRLILSKNEQYGRKAPKVLFITDHYHSLRDKTAGTNLYEDFIIPDNIQIAFAKDKPNDTLFNTIIKECDKMSNKYLSKLRNDGSVTIGDETFTVANLPVVEHGRLG